MPRVELQRNDLIVSFRDLPPGRLELTYAAPGGRGAKQVVQLARVADGLAQAPPSSVLEAWKGAPNAAGTSDRLNRVLIPADDVERAVLPWERVFGHLGVVVRASHTAFEPFKLPMRLVQVGARPGIDLPGLVTSLFGPASQDRVRKAVRFLTFSGLPELESRSALAAPTTDVLHVSWEVTGDGPKVGPPNDPDLLGTPAWFARYCFKRQTRLVVLSCTSPRAAEVRRLGSQLVAVGGPAVLVVSLHDEASRRRFLNRFYADLIHDFPLDVMFDHALGELTQDRDGACLFAGEGREEELRVSSAGLGETVVSTFVKTRKVPPEIPAALKDLRRRWGYQGLGSFQEHLRLLPLAENVARMRSLLKGRSISEAASDRGTAAPTFSIGPFPRGRAGLLEGPSARMGFQKPAKTPSRAPDRPPPPRRPAPSPGPRRTGEGPHRSTSRLEAVPESTSDAKAPRFVNIAFWRGEGPEKPLRPIAQRHARLVTDEVVQLGVDIGARRRAIRVSEPSPIDEERFRWKPQMKGVWVELGVTGIDFEVVGNPVRELWLPREGPSERVFFPVIPRGTAGVALLRVCLYHHDEVIQSFRVAAITSRAGRARKAEAATRQLAARLGLGVRAVGAAGFMSRLEYSTAPVAAVAARTAARRRVRLSIVANDLDGEPVITVKGLGVYSARVLTDDALPELVQKVRDLFLAISVVKYANATEGYAFGKGGRPNAGTPEQLDKALFSLALKGWRLFDRLLEQTSQEAVSAQLDGAEESVIHVAQILREKIIPWGLLYDRRYDPNRTADDEGNPVAFGVCHGGMPDANGEMPLKQCFGPGCLLNGYPNERAKDSRGKTLLPDTVVCPRHFWGFRHTIEVPPQQVPPGKVGVPTRTEIRVTSKAAIAAGVNRTLPLCDAHMKKLTTTTGKIPASWSKPESDRQEILELLKDAELCGVYFYCHATARGGDGDPELIFQGPEKGDPKGIITPDALGHNVRWQRGPLVFMNGCSTSGYRPEAMSPFFKKLVDDRGAAGIIGTEIIVREQLAGEMAQSFFQAFLDGKSAGAALLTARRALLGQNNPLGLVYTLYASAELRLTT